MHDAISHRHGPARAQTPPDHWSDLVPDQHAMLQWLVKWSDNLEKQSGGRIVVKGFRGSQMGPVHLKM